MPEVNANGIELHYEEHLAHRQEHIAAEWQDWGILPRVLKQHKLKEHS